MAGPACLLSRRQAGLGLGHGGGLVGAWVAVDARFVQGALGPGRVADLEVEPCDLHGVVVLDRSPPHNRVIPVVPDGCDVLHSLRAGHCVVQLATAPVRGHLPARERRLQSTEGHSPTALTSACTAVATNL
jgi:hypothetical protein